MSDLQDPMVYLMTAATLMALSGVPGLMLNRPVLGQRIATICVVTASLLGELAVLLLLDGALATTWQIDWPLPFGPALVSVDPLSSLFLFPLFLITGCASVFSLSYWSPRDHGNTGKPTLFLGLFAGAMITLVLARNGPLFLIAWEIMALSGFFLLTTEQHHPEVQRVGTIYLLTSHAGVAALLVLVSLVRVLTGTFDLPAPHSLTSTASLALPILLAALIGFGGKAGIMPLHFWLPGAHANAPSHVSAMMSGLMLKMGIYGLLRVLLWFQTLPDWLGWLLLLLGAWSALNGIALASVQQDIKRLLACSSIEHVGIIFMGIGLGLIGITTHAPYLVVCGFAGAFIHCINHALFKPLLFLASGIIIHQTGTRDIDRMGGLAKRLPMLSPLVLIGSLAICGLPPLNGFVSELFLYVGAITNGITAPLPLAALAAPVLALVGGLSIATFVKLYGLTFLGSPRTPLTPPYHKPGMTMIGVIGFLGALCMIFGMVPLLPVRLVTPAVSFFSGLDTLEVVQQTALVPLTPLMMVNILLVALATLVGIWYVLHLKNRPVGQEPTWGCGYLAPTPRMQYTGTSFSEMLVNLLGAAVAPKRRKPHLGRIIPGAGARFHYTVNEALLNQVLTPVFLGVGQAFSYLRMVQHGRLHLYVLYIVATLFVLMLWPH